MAERRDFGLRRAGTEPGLGEQLTPAYRDMLLDEEFTPVSELSASFMTPRSGQHLMFAYYQSSLVVAYLVETYGRECLAGILHDLGEGMDINAAIAKNAASMDEVDREFPTMHARRPAPWHRGWIGQNRAG